MIPMAEKLTEKVHHIAKWQNRERIFRDRKHAGIVLADMLAGYESSGATVLGIPAGGIPVAAVAAKELGLDLDVAVVSKITLPWNSEAGYGAVAFDGTVRLNKGMIRYAGLDENVVEEGIQSTSEKVARRVKEMRGGRPAPDLQDGTAIIIDDGIASGFTMRVAVEAVKNQGAAKIIVAAPTGEQDSVLAIAQEVHEVYCANLRGRPFAVAAAYENWRDVSEDEAERLLTATELDE
ncbi:MAG: phosphoribosyltransferase family protein [Armatimonadota bacterium]